MSRRDRQRRRSKAHGHPRRILLGILGFVLACGLAAAGVGAFWVLKVVDDTPALASLHPVRQGRTSVIYAANGKRLGFVQSDVLRTPVGADQIPENVRQATVAIEDKRFYDHGGVDLQGIVRAGVADVVEHRKVQGASTLEMQLIKNLYEHGEERTIKWKISEAKLAMELEDQHPGRAGKRWILDRYLNSVPYGTVAGQEAVGIQAAARVFFDKPAHKLTLREAALLAGLPQAPTSYNPFLHPALAKRRRNDVLRAMLGQHMITPVQARRAIRSGLGVARSQYYTQRRERYFFDYVKAELIKRYGAETVRQGGLKVYTTIKLRLQRLARSVISSRLPYPDDPSAALVSIDPRNGHILAMASSERYAESKFNLAAQGRRQPGSTFKVMVLMAAIRRGVDPKSTYYDSHPLNFDDPTWGPIDVQTDDHRYYGSSSLFDALVRSDNTVYQQLDLDVGPEAVRQTAYDMGITSHLDAYPAEGIGGLTHGVSPLEMARAYMTLNTGGVRLRPVAITKVVFPDGHVDRSLARPHRKRVFTDGETYEAIQAMEANVEGGTGTAAQIGCPAAGKTGTTSSFTDAWFDGFTTGLNTVVWVGYPDSTTSMTAVPGYGEMFGGTAPALIWHDFMSVAGTIGGRCQPFPQPTTPFVAKPFEGHYEEFGAPTGTDDTIPDTATTPVTPDTTTTPTTPTTPDTTTTPDATTTTPQTQTTTPDTSDGGVAAPTG